MTIRRSPAVYQRAFGLACLLAVAVAGGQQTSSGGSAEENSNPIAFRIAAQPMGPALKEFASQSHLQLVYETGDLDSAPPAPPIEGAYTPQAALNRLLANTKLDYAFLNQKTVSIRSAAASAPVAERRAGEAKSFRLAEEVSSNGDSTTQSESLPIASASDRRSDEEKGKSVALEQVVVTGTHLRGVTAQSSPVITYTRDDIDRSGAGTVEQFMRTVPQNLSAVDPTTSATNAVSLSQASSNTFFGSGVNLRGLGPNSTLVLVNGHRLAPASEDGSFVDISAIPLTAVERVEILTDGASAVYGSDAVAGVVNYILRTEFDGASTQLRYGDSTGGGGLEREASQLVGGHWEGGGALLSYDFHEQAPLDAAQRKFVGPLASEPFLLVPSQKRHSVFASIHQQVVADVTMSGDVLYSDRTFLFDEAYQAFPATLHATGGNHTWQTNLGLDFPLPAEWRGSFSGQYARNGQNASEIAKATIDSSTLASINYTTNVEVDSVDFHADGSFGAAPGGPIRGALGVAHRLEHFSDVGGLYGSGQRNVLSGYAEALLPLFGDANSRPALRRLELSVAGRFDHYDDFGSTTNPKIGLLWSPISAVILRATYGKSYQAPGLGQLFGTRDQSTAYPLQNSAASSGTTNTILNVPYGNPDLRPQRSRDVTAGLDFKPVEHPGLSLSLSYFDIHYTDKIAPPPLVGSIFQLFSQTAALAPFLNESPTASQIAQFYNSPGFINVFNVPATAIGAIFNEYNQNIASEREAGFDFSGSYGIETRAGKWTLSLAGTWINHLELQAASTTPFVEIANTTFNPPRLRGNAGLSWSLAGLESALTVRHVGAYANTLTVPNGEISSWTTTDFHLSYDTTVISRHSPLPGARISVTVQNMFNKNPPYVATPSTVIPLNFDAANASPLGRFISIELQKNWL